jgi:hypothetical protein
VFHPRNVLHTLLADVKRLSEEQRLPGDASTFRKIWRELSEDVIEKLDRSNACLHFTPVEIAVCALLSSENNAREAAGTNTLPVVPFRDYLLQRFGIAEAESLLFRARNASELIIIVDTAESSAKDAEFKAVSSYVYKKASWGRKAKKQAQTSSA